MVFSKIMVPYDGSEHAKNALEYAKGLMADLPAVRLEVVHVIPSGVMGLDEIGTNGALDGVPIGLSDYAQYTGVVQPVLDEARQKVIAHLDGALDGLEDRAEVQVIAGSSAASALVKHVEDSGCDLIVMGRRGLGAIRGMIGSVSFGILHGADVPVLTVK